MFTCRRDYQLQVLRQFQYQLMPLQLTPEVYKWLNNLAILKQARRNSNNLMEISEQHCLKLMDGYVFGIILRTILKTKPEDDKIKKIQALKQNSTPAIRLYNWGILTQLIKMLGHNIQYADKSKITSLDPQPLGKILSFLYQKRSMDPTFKQEQASDPLKVDINQIAKKTLKDSKNTLEFMTIAISKNFKISPQQTLNLFLDNNKYLSHLLAKGVKGSFQPVHALLNQVKNYTQFIVLNLFSLDQQENTNFLFTALRTCLISNNQATSQLCCNIMLQIYDHYRISNLNLQCLRNWISTQGMNTLFFAIKKHPLLFNSILTICHSYLDDDFFKYLQLSQKSILWSTQLQKYIFYKQMLTDCPQIFGKFAVTSHFQQWNRFFIKTMKKSHVVQEQLLVAAVMEEQWNRMGTKFEQSDLGLANIFVNFMKTLLMSSNQLLFIQAARTLFSLMQTLGAVKNSFAPLIYKVLLSGYSISDSQRIVFMTQNFIFALKGIPSLPGRPILPSLLKHLQNHMQYCLIELSSTLIEQRRITQEQTCEIFNILTRIVFQDVNYGILVLDIILEVFEHLSTSKLQQLLQQKFKESLQLFMTLSKGITKSLKTLRQQTARMQSVQLSPKMTESLIANINKHIISQNISKYIAKLLLADQLFKNKKEQITFQHYLILKVQVKKEEQAQVIYPLLASYYPQQDQLLEKIQQYRLKFYPPPKIQPPKDHNHKHSHAQAMLARSLSLKSKLAQQEQEPVFIDPATLKPSTYALKDLQKVKKKRYEMKTIQLNTSAMLAKKQQKIQKFLTIQNEKRVVQSMSTVKNDVEYKHTQLTQENIQYQSHQATPGLRLINLQKDEQISYQQDAQSVMRKYRKVWRYLFYKYSGKKNELGGQEKAHNGQIWKMLKDYDFNFLKKEDCFTIVRLINENSKRRNDLQTLTYSGFEDFILQVSVLGYSKIQYAHLPPAQLVILFVEQLKKVTREKAGSIQIFDNPEEAYFQENQVIRQFNKRLKDNPEYILPQGYKRVKQTTLDYEYNFHPMLQKNINSPYIQVLQILDWLISNEPKLAFHIIQPLSIKNQVFLAKPVLFQNISQKMKQYSKGYLNPRRILSASKQQKPQSLLPSPPNKAKKQIKPYVNFSLGVKLGLAQTSINNKSIAQQVAYCMQDIIKAIQNQTTVKKGNKNKIINDFMKRKKVQAKAAETERKKEYVNWKKRADSVKLQLDVLRQKRKENDKQKKKHQFLQRRKKKERQEKLFKQKKEQFDRVKAQLQQNKQRLLKLKQEEEQRLQQEKEEYRQGVQDYFRKKKQQIKEKQEAYKRKKQEQLDKKTQQQEKKAEFAKKLYMNNLKKQQEVLQKIDQIKDAYDQVWEADQIQDYMATKKDSLKLLFDLLLKYQKSKISATSYDEICVSTLNYFCLKFQLMPNFLQKQDVQKIFMQVIKNTDQDKKASRRGVNCQKFAQILFLIAIKGKKLFNKLARKRQRKQQKLNAFLNAKSSGQGNHYELSEVSSSESSSQEQEEEQEDINMLQKEYLFNASGVDEDTMKELFMFLRLPRDKLSMEERYKQAVESKNNKPRNVAIRQLKASLS